MSKLSDLNRSVVKCEITSLSNKSFSVQSKIFVIAAGGIASGKGMLSTMVLGADGVQVGSRFAASKEASSHKSFKDEIVKAKDGSTLLTLKEVTPVRLIKNKLVKANFIS